jgi:hypothetical protein
MCVMSLMPWIITNTLLFFMWPRLIYIAIVMLCILMCLLYFRYCFHNFRSLSIYFWLNSFVSEFTGISMPFSFLTISYRFHFWKNNVKLRMIWPPINRFRPFSSVGNVQVNSEAPVVTSWISRFTDSVLQRFVSYNSQKKRDWWQIRAATFLNKSNERTK